MRRVLVLSLLALTVASCRPADSGDGGRLSVVAALHPLAELAREIGGDRVRVTDLTPAGAEPHDLELSPGDIDDILDADLVLYLGDDFQPAVADAVDRAEGARLDALAASPGGQGDPHVWLVPAEMANLAQRIGAALDEVAGTEQFGAAADRLAGRLVALDREIDAGLRGCARTTLVTAHAAFGRFATRYGLVQQAITGISPEAEPDPKRLDELAEIVEREGVTTVFTEELVSPAVAEALAREAGVGTAVLDTVEGPTGDGAPYEERMRRNLAVLRIALGCP